MLIPLTVAGVACGLIFKSSRTSDLEIFRNGGMVSSILSIVALAIVTFIKAGLAGFGGAVLAVSAMLFAAVMSDLILYTIFSYFKNVANNPTRGKGTIINMIGADAQTLASLGVDLSHMLPGNTTVNAALLEPHEEIKKPKKLKEKKD